MTRVLIVDDHRENLYLLRAMLEGHGFVVVEAIHGTEALAKAHESPPDLTISDLLMPVMDGYTLLRHWRSDEQLKSIPFVVYTATYTDPRDERLALDLGADAFIVKPAEPEDFMVRIQEALKNSPKSRPPQIRPPNDPVLLNEYNDVLVRKIEQKAQLLEQSNRELREEIAERKRTETALRDSEERYRGLFQAISEPLFVYDRETLRYLAVNEAAVERYGYSHDEFMSMTIRDVRPPEDVPALLAMLNQSTGGRERRGVWRHRKKSGEIIEVEISTYELEFAGRPACLAEARDVTEIRRAQAEVARSSELLRAVADQTPDLVFVKDRQGRYLLFNRAAARYAGKEVEEVLGKDDTTIFCTGDAQKVMGSDRLVMESNQPQVVEELLTTVEGRRTFQSIKNPYRNDRGEVIGVIGITRDISAQKAAEETLRLRDRAIQAVSQGILITDASLPDNPIIFASHGFERMTGYSVDEAVGRNCRFLQGKDTDPQTVEQLRQAIAAGQGCSVEILNYRKGDEPFWNQLTISPVRDAAGHVAHFVGVQTDVTARRRLEEQFRQSQKMEAIGQLAGGVAHDFNNLLTVINGYSDLLRATCAPEDPRRELIAEISRAGERAGALTRQLLAFSRQQVLEPKVLDLNSVISDTERLLRRLIGEDVELKTILAPDLGRVKADPGQIEQVLMNLSVNARDAMPTGGKITIETRNVILDTDYCRTQEDLIPGGYVLLAVSDSGCGMDEATQARVFEPFFTTKAKGKGTGLGLATVHGIVKQSRGHVVVYSEVGLGTTLKIYLPRVDVIEPVDQPEPIISGMPRGSETVLLVEDEDAVRALAAHILRGCGYDVIEAADGAIALQLSAELDRPIHLLVSDIVMPHVGGRIVAERVTARFPECRVLFLSGYTDDVVIRHGILEAEFAFLQKPFTPASLAQKVRRTLDATNHVAS